MLLCFIIVRLSFFVIHQGKSLPGTFFEASSVLLLADVEGANKKENEKADVNMNVRSQFSMMMMMFLLFSLLLNRLHASQDETRKF